jgi:hypothetical protein
MMEGKPKYVKLGHAFNAYQNCLRLNNIPWLDIWEEEINKVIESLPSGSGLDTEITLDFEKSKPNKLILRSFYHCMNENGMYDGWEAFSVIISPDWENFNIEVKGKWRNRYSHIKDYICDIFADSLSEIID